MLRTRSLIWPPAFSTNAQTFTLDLAQQIPPLVRDPPVFWILKSTRDPNLLQVEILRLSCLQERYLDIVHILDPLKSAWSIPTASIVVGVHEKLVHFQTLPNAPRPLVH